MFLSFVFFLLFNFFSESLLKLDDYSLNYFLNVETNFVETTDETVTNKSEDKSLGEKIVIEIIEIGDCLLGTSEDEVKVSTIVKICVGSLVVLAIVTIFKFGCGGL